MTVPRSAAYRDALQVSAERIASMGDDEINSLMLALLCAQAHRCGADLSQIVVNTEGIAKDDGSDGWSPTPTTADSWLGSAPTCWQFKAGVAGEPSRLSGEVTKRIPAETLSAGGRFVLVASGSTNGKKGVEARLATLTTDASAAHLPTSSIDVLGSERLTVWCNQHPAIAARWAGRPDGLWLLDDWERSDEHRVPWQSTPALEQQIAARRQDLNFLSDTLLHLHIHGPPGVGKTRLALELCRGAPWKSTVIYIRQATDMRLSELLDGAAGDPGARLVVVADEVQPEQLRPLRDSVGRGQGRIRLITIGHSKTPDPTRIPALSVQPLDDKPMTDVVSGWYAGMPREHVDFVVRFADGYVRLARLAAEAVMRNPSIDVRGLLDQDYIRAFLDGMLGHGERVALYVVAALTSVGWTDGRQAEGEAVARHFGIDWNTVRQRVDDYDRRLGIAPRGGRLRYISPTPLAIHLAVEAWTTFPDLMRSLPDALPSEEAKDAYYERLQTIASNPQARRFAREELSSFFHLDDYLDARAARRWSVLAASDPVVAARNLADALVASPLEARLQLAGRARRELVWCLVRLAWKSGAFRDAVTALALLAEAENETWANNATAEFVARYQVFLGGTAVPYLQRLEVLDELASRGRPAITRLVVRALTKIGDHLHTRMVAKPVANEAPEPEWGPSDDQEHLACAVAALTRLVTLAHGGEPLLEADFIKAASNLAMLLRERPMRAPVGAFFEATRGAYPAAREPLRRAIADVISRERKYWNELAPAELGEIEVLHHQFEDASLGARLHQFVGVGRWDESENPALSGLAGELAANHAVLTSEWAWLTSGEAGEAWRFGEALALADKIGALEAFLPEIEGAGRDLRILCGYVSKMRELKGDAWYDQWVAKRDTTVAATLPLLFEITWRCGATEATIRILTQAVREHGVSEHVAGQLGFGRWQESLSQPTLHDFLAALVQRDQSAAAIAVVEHRLKSKPEEAAAWEGFAVNLIVRAELIRASQMTSYSWKEVALRLLPKHADAIAEAILHEQSDRTAGTWFAEHSEAGEVLRQCVETSPSGVWRSLTRYLGSPKEAYVFTIGFPRGLLERVPVTDVKTWIAGDATERAPIVARLVSKNLASDETLASQVLADFGDDKNVNSAFFSSFISGSWTGPASAHWEELAGSLDEVAHRTTLPRLRRWAQRAASSLHSMAERDRQREEEEEVRGR